jgi:DNA 3'-phosphatase
MKPVRHLSRSIITQSLNQTPQQLRHLSTRFNHNEQNARENHHDDHNDISTGNFTHIFSPSTIGHLKRLAYQPINSIAKLALRKLFQLGDPMNNAHLATTSINKALSYSVGTSLNINKSAANMDQSPVCPSTRRSPASHNKIEDDDKAETVVSTPSAEVKLEALEDLKSGNTLDSLREAYAKSRKEASSNWLDFAHKSCYIYLYRGGGEPSQSLAAFDLDGTLIRPKSNKRIPRNAKDWDLFSVWTKIKLQQCLREDHARFVIFTNQNGVGLEIVPLQEVQHRIELVTKRLDIPCTVFVAIEKDVFRKPQTGMFQLFNKCFNDLLEIDLSRSFYCGDAVGHPSHSDADIKFAQQLGFPFVTPEKFIRGVKPKLVA